MKKIIYIITMLLMSISVFGQDNKLPKDFDEHLIKEYEKRKKNWDGDFELFKKIQIEAFQQKSKAKSINTIINNDPCYDSGFESGILSTSNWSGFYKKYTESNFDCSNAATNNINTTIWTAGLVDLAPTSCEYPGWTILGGGGTHCTIPSICSGTNESTLSHFHIESVGNDPIIGTLLPKVRPYSGNNKSLRLGNAFPWNGTEKLTKTFTVNSTNQIFSFWYALVMGRPDDHIATQLPTFIIQVIENNSLGSFVAYHNNLVNLSGSLNYISAYDPLVTSTSTYLNPCGMIGAREPLVYKPWSFQSIDLSSLIGKNVTIEIITRDCAPTGHFSYAYLDDFCSKPDASNPSGSILIGPKDTCGVGNICVNYKLPISATATGSVKLFLNIYQNGSLITTLNSGSTWLNSGTNYCFPITSSLLSTLTADGHFDYSISGDFKIGTTSLPSQYIGISGSGQDLVNNNDYTISCTPTQSKSCCNNKLQMVTPTAVPPSYPYNEGTYGVEKYNITVPNDVPITEVRVNVMSFEWKSDKEDCKQCQIKPVNLGSLYGGFSIGGIFVGPTLQAYGPGTPATSNNNEVVFSFPTGKSFVVGDFMRLTYLLPPEKDLTCCQTKAHVCFKISWKDINCGYCEVYTCSDIDLKNPSELRPGFTLPDRTTLYLNSRNIFAPTHADGF